MSQRPHRPEAFGKAGMITAIVALVAAMAGGAYAASGPLASSSGSHWRQARSQAKGLTKAQVLALIAKAEKSEPAGPQGPAGANGKDGAQGPKGDTGPPGLKGEAGRCSEEDPECTLASGATLSGTWGFSGTEGVVPISYPLRLTAPISSSNVFLLDEGEGETEDCPGTEAEPEAAAGDLCLYTSNEAKNLAFFGFPKSSMAGTVLLVNETAGIAAGTWAVTAP
jgi:hypothetical protein